jgi:RNA polymerase sigma-70 factor, ECF subfamily
MQEIDSLVYRLQQGELDAFTDLFQRCETRVYRLALAILNNTQDAEDITQEVFLRVFRRIDTFQYQAAFNTWLTAIVVNTCRDFIRRQKIHQVISLDWLHPQPASREPTLADGIEQEREKRNLWACVAELDNKYRLPMVLFYREGLCAGEVAQILNLPVKTVYSRLNTAREHLQKHLKV